MKTITPLIPDPNGFASFKTASGFRVEIGAKHNLEAQQIKDFIVRACNAHEQLVNAAKAVREGWGKNLTGPMAMLMRALEGLPLDAIPKQDKTPSIASKVCEALQARNVLCHLEYQDWINIPMGDEFNWAFGDMMSKYWEGNFSSSDGNNLVNLTLAFRSDHQSDGKDIADAIYEALRKFDHHAFGAPPFEPNES